MQLMWYKRLPEEQKMSGSTPTIPSMNIEKRKIRKSSGPSTKRRKAKKAARVRKNEECDHVVEIAKQTNGPGDHGRLKIVKKSELEHINLWRDFNERLFKCSFCPKCGEKLEK